MNDIELPSWMDREPMGERETELIPPEIYGEMERIVIDAERHKQPAPRQYDRLATELIARIHAVPAVDHEHVKGIRLIRDRLNAHLAELADFDRSGVTG